MLYQGQWVPYLVAVALYTKLRGVRYEAVVKWLLRLLQ